ncbi:MAG: ribonuclease J [Actinomycetota bacterium]|nr:ribonuclease J [Actinomycetota bacterium]
MAKYKLRIIPLGGLGEIGKNMMVIESPSEMIVIDAGQMFPEDEMYGIDLVLPDFDYVRRHKDKLKGIIITHGHEDHTGALPYLLREFNVPVYGTRLTLGLITAKLAEFGIKRPRLKEVSPEQQLRIGSLKVNFIRVCHSIPDGVGLAIETPLGYVVHTGDFKFDQTPVDGKPTEFDRFSAYSGKALVLLSDSTNAEMPGYNKTEKSVGESLRELIGKARGRVIIASFASHIHRIQQAMDAAAVDKRKIAVVGRSMINNVGIASELGYLKIPPGALVDIAETKNMPPSKVMLVSTGSQGEPMSALARMAGKSHKYVDIVPGDTVIISANPVPGNEKSVSRIIDLLFKAGADVYYKSVSDVHVSGHAAQEELKMMLNLVKPKYFIPIHGEYRHLKYHALLAEKVGIPRSNILVAENGHVLEFSAKGVKRDERVEAGMTFVDGLGVGDIGDLVIRDRQLLAQDGICVVVVTINTHTKQIIGGPDIISRGFVLEKESAELYDEAKAKVMKAISRELSLQVMDWAILRNETRSTLSRFFYERTKRRPIIIPILVEI